MARSLRIIVADDEPDMREYFRKCLARLGHQVIAVAENGRELVALCQKLRPDLVISDIRMPDKDGIVAAEEIQREQAVPVLLVSAVHDADLAQRAASNYVVSYLVKPIKEADLRSSIDVAMGRLDGMDTKEK